jgi:hypothetical protein
MSEYRLTEKMMEIYKSQGNNERYLENLNSLSSLLNKLQQINEELNLLDAHKRSFQIPLVPLPSVTTPKVNVASTVPLPLPTYQSDSISQTSAIVNLSIDGTSDILSTPITTISSSLVSHANSAQSGTTSNKRKR